MLFFFNSCRHQQLLPSLIRGILDINFFSFCFPLCCMLLLIFILLLQIARILSPSRRGPRSENPSRKGACSATVETEPKGIRTVTALLLPTPLQSADRAHYYFKFLRVRSPRCENYSSCSFYKISNSRRALLSSSTYLRVTRSCVKALLHVIYTPIRISDDFTPRLACCYNYTCCQKAYASKIPSTQHISVRSVPLPLWVYKCSLPYRLNYGTTEESCSNSTI